MTLTDNHVSDEWLNEAIEYWECTTHSTGRKILLALIELKQRRAESRVDDFLHKAMNGIEDKAKTACK